MTRRTTRTIGNSRAELSARYLGALRAELERNGPGSGRRAAGVGRDVVASGLGTLDLARMHEQALVALASRKDFRNEGKGVGRRAGIFFAEVLVPMERAHRAARASFRQLQQRADELRRHASALAEGNRQLKREVARRKAGEAAVKAGKEHYQVLFLQSQIMQRKLRQLARQIISAQEDERREISRELHDGVVQTLVGINVQLAALGKAASLGTRALKGKIARTQRLVGKSVNAVHQFARELRPALLDDLGLIPALQSYMKKLAAKKKLKIRMTAFAGVESLDNARRTVLYRVAQESLTNVARHARAGQVNVNLRPIPGGVCMTIHDDGKSFEVLQTLSSRTNRRLGLLGMRERLEMVGGTLNIESTPGRGTTVRAEIPVSEGGLP